MSILSCFRMPTPVKIIGRTSTITNSFVNGILPPGRWPNEEELSEALEILGLDADDLRCAYCGDAATEWDHLRPLVTRKRPTGFISEIANLVPACGKCNQSKGAREWQEWMMSSAPRSPATRGIPDLEERVRRLERFVEWKRPTWVNFEKEVGDELWESHWKNLDRLVALMRECEDTARQMREVISNRLQA
ncbi:MAG TPA: HNH endonuclease [Pyrinomonadaceae bacterium]|nr:HNH endonuclease [Pyrinomonadaceae bacterium]